jgi:protein translocase SecG subunit
MENSVATVRLIGQILVFLSAVGIIVGYLLQSPKSAGLGAISGSASIFRSRKPLDAFLDKLISWSAVIFIISTFLLAVLRQS